ncbi:hypothetical protein Bbelb_085940 [Branchiostoma belcheri]|nr:hypothetical protein Bbelb_085940 [Branchiostoma belcheri]
MSNGSELSLRSASGRQHQFLREQTYRRRTYVTERECCSCGMIPARACVFSPAEHPRKRGTEVPVQDETKWLIYRSRDKHHRDSGFCGISRGSLRDITRETAGYPAGVCGISRGRLRDIPRYSFGRPVVSRVPRSEKTWCETPKPTAARNGDGGVPNVYFYVLPGDLCWADGV